MSPAELPTIKVRLRNVWLFETFAALRIPALTEWALRVIRVQVWQDGKWVNSGGILGVDDD